MRSIHKTSGQQNKDLQDERRGWIPTKLCKCQRTTRQQHQKIRKVEKTHVGGMMCHSLWSSPQRDPRSSDQSNLKKNTVAQLTQLFIIICWRTQNKLSCIHWQELSIQHTCQSCKARISYLLRVKIKWWEGCDGCQHPQSTVHHSCRKWKVQALQLQTWRSSKPSQQHQQMNVRPHLAANKIFIMCKWNLPEGDNVWSFYKDLPANMVNTCLQADLHKADMPCESCELKLRLIGTL